MLNYQRVSKDKTPSWKCVQLVFTASTVSQLGASGKRSVYQKPSSCSTLQHQPLGKAVERGQITMEIVSFPIKNCDFPIKNGDFPIKNGDFPIKNGDFPIKNGDFPIKNCDFPMKIMVTFWKINRPINRPKVDS